jgi:hypothetical protein
MEFIFTAEQEAWLNDLETTEAKQGIQRLHSIDDEFCCLGRWCVVSETTSKKYIDMLYGHEYDGETVLLSRDLFERLGLRDQSGGFSIAYRHVDLAGTVDHMSCLVDLNDHLKWSFKQIAEFIRENPERVFVTDAGEE